jgi:tetratricopeptide (TPR) repeat protein
MKIAVYAIAKNESENVEAWLENLADADGIFVLDTGSTDDTISLLNAGGATVEEMNYGKKFRFDQARNQAMHLVPKEFDVLVSVDFDERLSPGWREAIEQEFDEETDVANYTLVYNFDSEGNIITSYPRMAVHRHDSATWHYAVHELLMPLKPHKRKTLNFMCVHYGKGKPAGHYLDLLKLCREEHPNDPRAMGYLAREYFGMGNFTMAKPLYQDYIRIEPYPPMQSEACIRIAQMSPDFISQEWWLRQAVQLCNDMREPYCEMALLYFRNEMWEHCIAYTKSAMQHKKPNYDTIYRDEFYTDTWAWHMLMAAYQQDGNYRKALHAQQQLLTAYGNNIPQHVAKDIMVLQGAVNEVYYAYRDCVRSTGSETPK